MVANSGLPCFRGLNGSTPAATPMNAYGVESALPRACRSVSQAKYAARSSARAQETRERRTFGTQVSDWPYCACSYLTVVGVGRGTGAYGEAGAGRMCLYGQTRGSGEDLELGWPGRGRRRDGLGLGPSEGETRTGSVRLHPL